MQMAMLRKPPCDDAMRYTAGSQGRIGEHAHEPLVRAPIDQRQSALSDGFAQSPSRVDVALAAPCIGTAEDRD